MSGRLPVQERAPDTVPTPARRATVDLRFLPLLWQDLVPSLASCSHQLHPFRLRLLLAAALFTKVAAAPPAGRSVTWIDSGGNTDSLVDRHAAAHTRLAVFVFVLVRVAGLVPVRVIVFLVAEAAAAACRHEQADSQKQVEPATHSILLSPAMGTVMRGP
jgi:hypothetical protein